MKFCGRPLLHVRIGDAEEEIGAVVAGQGLGAERRAGGRIVDRGGVAGVRQDRLLGRVGQRVENLLPVPPAEFELVLPAVPGVVLLAAEYFGVLAARHDAVDAHVLIVRIVDVGRAVRIERIRRAEQRGDVLLRARLIQAVLPVDQRER